MFLELTDREQLEHWLPKLVGIERAAYVRVGDERVQSTPEEAHAAQLSREEMTASVHYVRFELSASQVAAFGTGEVAIGLDHPAYPHEVVLTEETRQELLRDVQD